MKGIELPINALIIIAIAVIVLIALVSMFYSTFSSSSVTVSLDMAKSQACRALVEGNNCNTNVNTWNIPVYNFDANKDKATSPGSEPLAAFPTCNLGGKDNLARLCACYYQLTTENDCRKMCSC
jgi:flagellar basal body-associated protein FliL